MEKINIKIGRITYSDVSVINVDKADGGTADFIYNGVVAPARIITYVQDLHVTSKAHINTPTITNFIVLR